MAFVSLVNQIENKFLILFPNGFEDKEWLKLSKKHTIIALDTIFKTTLSKKEFKQHLKDNNIEKIILDVKKAVQSSTTISMFEKMAFRNYMTDISLHKNFAKLLFNFLYVDYKKYFADFTHYLTKTQNSISNSNCAKWSIVTFFLMQSDKNNHVFLKPTTAKKIAYFFNEDIEYQSYPNIDTYEKFKKIILKFKEKSKLTKNKETTISQAVIFCALSIMHE